MPAITVILPTRKRNHLLPRALKSLYAQSISDFEIVLVDDNPPENRLRNDAALDGVLLDERLRLVENGAPRNAATARNCGLRIARGRWVTYLDDDDAYQPTKLEKQLKQAERTGLPIGLCGLAYNLPGRRRLRQIGARSFKGKQLLLGTLADTKAIFHRNLENFYFDENLDAGEDTHFFFRLIIELKVQEVFNVPEALIDVYPQPDGRVNLNGEALWAAAQAIRRDCATLFSEAEMEIFMRRAALQRCRFGGSLTDMLQHSFALLKLTRLADARLVANTILFRVPWLRRRLVS